MYTCILYIHVYNIHNMCIICVSSIIIIYNILENAKHCTNEGDIYIGSFVLQKLIESVTFVCCAFNICIA